jgi:hypothetical protein
MAMDTTQPTKKKKKGNGIRWKENQVMSITLGKKKKKETRPCFDAIKRREDELAGDHAWMVHSGHFSSD